MSKTKKPIKRVREKKEKMAVTCDLSGPHGAGGRGFLRFNEPVFDGTGSINFTKKRNPDFDRLVGSWVRPDGGYVIEIRKIHPDGKVDAAYFNPSPIHVSRSTVSEKNGIIELFLELQGQGYPGSTYTLRYNPVYDAMVGIYFQAVIQQPFDVIFQRK